MLLIRSRTNEQTASRIESIEPSCNAGSQLLHATVALVSFVTTLVVDVVVDLVHVVLHPPEEAEAARSTHSKGPPLSHLLERHALAVIDERADEAPVVAVRRDLVVALEAVVADDDAETLWSPAAMSVARRARSLERRGKAGGFLLEQGLTIWAKPRTVCGL